MIISLLIYSIITINNSIKYLNTEDSKAFCGNENATEIQNQDEGIFNANCAACHKLKANSIGPALTQIDSLVFWKWMNEDFTIEVETFNEQKEDFNQKEISKHLNNEELGMLLIYISNIQH